MRRLYKSRKYKVIDGVCGGIAEYFDVDPVIIRLIFVISIVVGGTGIIAYIIGMIIIPHKPSDLAESESSSKKETTIKSEIITNDKSKKKSTATEPEKKEDHRGGLIFGIILLIIGAFFLMSEFRFFHGPYYWIRHHIWDILIPSILILLGINLILKKR